MRLSKFLSLVGFITFFSLIYVWQQTEVFRLAYLGQKNTIAFQDLLDKNNILRYNIEKSASLVRIGSRVSQAADFQMPDNYQLVRLASSKRGFGMARQLPDKESLFSRLFGVKREAEAKTVDLKSGR